jgi:toxin ParE1/3/4
MPSIGALLGLDEFPYEGIRRWHIDGFDCLMILYREVADGIEVIRVLHIARDVPAVLRSAPTIGGLTTAHSANHVVTSPGNSGTF